MSSIIDRKLNRANEKSPDSSTSFTSTAEFRGRLTTLGSQVALFMVPLGLAALVALSVANGKMFLQELLLSSFVIIALMFFKASATPRK